MASSTTYAALPYPALSDTPNVPSDMQALATRLDTVLSNLVGGGSTIPGTALNLSQVPGQISTLNNRPIVQQAYVAQRTSTMTLPSATFSDQTVQTLTVPSQTWLRLLVVYMSSTWGWGNASTTNTLRSRLKTAGVSRTEAMQTGNNATLSAFHFETVPVGSSVTITQTVNCYQANQSGTAQTQEMDPVIYAVAIPWFGVSLTNITEI